MSMLESLTLTRPLYTVHDMERIAQDIENTFEVAVVQTANVGRFDLHFSRSIDNQALQALLERGSHFKNPHDAVKHPAHYTSGKIEVWDFIIDQQLNFQTGNVVKYVCRAGKKDPQKHLEDLNKAKAYLEREIKRISDNATDF